MLSNSRKRHPAVQTGEDRDSRIKVGAIGIDAIRASPTSLNARIARTTPAQLETNSHA
jgi:hypothetical protein